MNHRKSIPLPCEEREVRPGFTLVELIVVVTILAILATIGFVSYSSYLTGVRDTNRLAQLVSISDGLELYRTKKDLPLPDDNIEVKTNGNTIAYQGNAGANTLETIDFTKGGVDPRDGSYFTYYLTEDRKYFQLLGFLEEESNITSSLINQVQALDYTTRIPTVYGKKLGILTDMDYNPIQDITLIASAGEFNITSATTGYIAHMTDDISLTDTQLITINPNANCQRIKQLRGGSSDGVFTINPTGALDAEFKAYCDMTIDGGGWTLVGSSAVGGTGVFGWNTLTGIAGDFDSPYSMGVLSKDINFSQLLVSRYSSPGVHELAATLDVDNTQRINDVTGMVSTNLNFKVIYDDGLLLAEKSWNHGNMFKVWGNITSTSSYYFRDCCGTSSHGLTPSGYSTAGYLSNRGAWHGRQGMIFVR